MRTPDELGEVGSLTLDVREGTHSELVNLCTGSIWLHGEAKAGSMFDPHVVPG